jgi:hypothetical protein
VINFLKKIPTVWDESLLLSGYPGKEVIVARRNGSTWYIGGISGEFKHKVFKIPLIFLESGQYTTEIISDGQSNMQFKEDQNSCKPTDVKSVQILPYGGFVAVINPVKK